jgi:Uma2 family endonuclease
MSAILKSTNRISPEDYLEGEKFAEFRHEYADGYVYAMAGASDDHNRITGNLFAVIHSALRGKRCEPFSTDMKVKIPPTFADVFYYPDVMVVCDPTDNSKYFRESPSIIFEVISPETERTDRREKAIAYRQIPTIEAYILVEQDRVAATVLLRADQGWRSELLEGPGSVLKLPGINVETPLERIYERTSLAGAGKQTS